MSGTWKVYLLKDQEVDTLGIAGN